MALYYITPISKLKTNKLYSGLKHEIKNACHSKTIKLKTK